MRLGDLKGPAIVSCALIVLTVALTARLRAQNSTFYETACAAGNPYFAVSCFAVGPWPPTAGQAVGRPARPQDPAIVAVRDTLADDLSDHEILVPQRAVGAVYGLAYDWRRHQLYAAAYHKRMTVFGPGGPGAIYLVDLDRSSAHDWARLEAGPDQHDTSA